MIGVPAFCCLPIDISVRLIGTINLIIYVLVFITLVSNPDVVLKDDKIRIIFGFNSQFFNYDTLPANFTEFQGTPNYFNCSAGNIFFKGKKISGIVSIQVFTFLREFSQLFAQWFPIFCSVFTLTSAVSSVLLIGGSITAQRWFTVPWLMCSVFNVVCHFTSLIMLSFFRSPSVSEWVTAFAVLYSVTLLYFILVVVIAHYLWWIQSKESYFNPGCQTWETIYKSHTLFESLYKNPI